MLKINKKKHKTPVFIALIGFLYTAMATANAQADKALTYAAVNTTIATTTAIALQKAGYQTQTISTPNGLVTTIKDPNANTTQQSASDDNNNGGLKTPVQQM